MATIITDKEIIKDIVKEISRKPDRKAIKNLKKASALLKKLRS
jgi:hypothetical protein